MTSASKIIYSMYEESVKDNVLVCTQEELNNYNMCGLIRKSKGNYIDRNNRIITVDLVKPTTFNINLQGLITKCDELSQKHNEKRIYCVSSKTYDKLKQQGFVITKNGLEFYRLYDKEFWLLYVL